MNYSDFKTNIERLELLTAPQIIESLELARLASNEQRLALFNELHTVQTDQIVHETNALRALEELLAQAEQKIRSEKRNQRNQAEQLERIPDIEKVLAELQTA